MEEKLPNWERLLLDIVQEEIRRTTRDGVSFETKYEKEFALAGKGNKFKGKKAQGKTKSRQNGCKEKKDTRPCMEIQRAWCSSRRRRRTLFLVRIGIIFDTLHVNLSSM